MQHTRFLCKKRNCLKKGNWSNDDATTAAAVVVFAAEPGNEINRKESN